MTKILAALFLAFVGLIASALPSFATGVTAYSIGGSSTTALVVLSVTPKSFWGIDVSSANASDLFKCWDSTTTSGLTFASAPTLAGVDYQVQTSGRTGPAANPVNATRGVVCAKNSTSAEELVYLSAY